jgi:sarcosine/dimethylglycine N-methyltransferase
MIASSAAQQGKVNYYDGPEIADAVFDSLRDAGLDTERLEIDDLALLDEFHALGRPATVALAELCAIGADADVLDVGAGLGGPARVLAHRYGARVTALDRTARFCSANRRLCAATGLSDRVEVVCADALELPFPDQSFDLAWMQAVSQNVADKPALMRGLRRVLRAGGRLALFEVASGPGGPLHFPVPWADGPGDSFLVSSAELLRIVEDAGFEPLTWNVGPDALAEIARAADAAPAAGPDRGVNLKLLMPNFDERMAGLGRNVGEHRIELVQAVLTVR